MTDSELRALIRANPAQGHRALYDTYANYAYAIIARYLADCGSREDIEDCLVETFTEVMLHIGTITGDSIKAYIGASARNRALNYCTSLRRQRLHTVPMEDTAEPSVQHVQEQAEARAMQAQLLQEIKALGEPDATIVIQKYYYGMKMHEIAGMVGLKPNTAQARCGRALKLLRKRLKDWR